MGGVSRFFYFNQGSMARKLHKHKERDDVLDAPRNSLELQVESSQIYNGVGDISVEEEDCAAKSYYPNEAATKKMVDEKTFQQAKSKQNAPNIVARLMGMDTMPVDTRPVLQHDNEKNKKFRVERSARSVRGSNAQLSSKSNSPWDMELDTLRTGQNQRFGRPKPREHPQEEQLQKFKKEFEAWQAARVRECSNAVNLRSSENCVHHSKHKMECFPDEQEEWFSSRSRRTSVDFEQRSFSDYAGKMDIASRIVILKPGPDLTSPSGSLEERGGIENFLEEVRERLKLELQGKALKRSSVVRGSGIETPYREKPSGAKQIARNFAKQIRENVRSRDGGRKLTRSESSRSFRSEIQLNEPASPNYISREMSPRKLSRSLSAPISAASFGKLLLEDRQVMAGARISRKHECIDNEPVVEVKRKKERFNFKEKVSNIRFSFPLRKMLFQKKIQSMVESQNEFMSETSSINFNESHDNSTEVPPSPVSICSSAHEECWRQADNLSPISTPDHSTPGEHNDFSQVFKEISSNLTALRKQLQELESEIAEEKTFDEEPTDYHMMDIEDHHAEAYIRNLLVASGLYDGTSNKPISIKIFEQVEESYRKSSSMSAENDHRMLLDLLNEALSRVLEPPISRFRRKMVSSSSPFPPLCKEKLLKSVWKIVSAYLYPQNVSSSSSYDYSLGVIVDQDFNSFPWIGMVDDEIDGIGMDVAHYILEDIVDETLNDLRRR